MADVDMKDDGATVSEIVDLTEDKGVIKEILKASDKEEAMFIGAEILVNYEGRLSDGTVFDTSFDKDPIRVVIGTGQVIKGWEIGVMSMKLGERAEFTLAPEYGYGHCGSPPGIPDGSTLIFDIEVLEIKERRPTRWMMTDTELIQAAETKKDLGNA